MPARSELAGIPRRRLLMQSGAAALLLGCALPEISIQFPTPAPVLPTETAKPQPTQQEATVTPKPDTPTPKPEITPLPVIQVTEKPDPKSSPQFPTAVPRRASPVAYPTKIPVPTEEEKMFEFRPVLQKEFKTDKRRSMSPFFSLLSLKIFEGKIFLTEPDGTPAGFDIKTGQKVWQSQQKGFVQKIEQDFALISDDKNIMRVTPGPDSKIIWTLPLKIPQGSYLFSVDAGEKYCTATTMSEKVFSTKSGHFTVFDRNGKIFWEEEGLTTGIYNNTLVLDFLRGYNLETKQKIFDDPLKSKDLLSQQYYRENMFYHGITNNNGNGYYYNLDLKTGNINWITDESADDISTIFVYFGKDYIYLFSRDKKDSQLSKVRKLNIANGKVSPPILQIRDTNVEVFETLDLTFISELNNNNTHILDSNGGVIFELNNTRINIPIGIFNNLIICEARDTLKTTNRLWKPSVIYGIDSRAKKTVWSFTTESDDISTFIQGRKLFVKDSQKIKIFDTVSGRQIAENTTLKPKIMIGTKDNILFFYNDTQNPEIGKITLLDV